MKTNILYLILLLFIVLLSFGCSDEDSAPPSKVLFITLGDSLAHGIQNYGQSTETQMAGYSYQMGMALKQNLGDENVIYSCPLVSSNGIARMYPDEIPTNLGIGSSKVHHILDTSPTYAENYDERTSNVQTFMTIIYGSNFPRSYTQLDAGIFVANELNPGGDSIIVMILEVGGNDLLSILYPEDPTTSVEDLTADYQTIVDRIMAECPSNLHLFLTTIPDLSKIGTAWFNEDFHFYLDDLDPDYADIIDTYLASDEGYNGDPDVYIRDLITITTTGDDADLEAFFADAPNNIDQDIMDAFWNDLAGYNDYIRNIAANNSRIHIIEFADALHYVDDTAFTVSDKTLSNKWGVRGGLFSLDGIHATSTANAILSNIFLERIYQVVGWNEYYIDVESVFATDPFQIDEDGDGFCPELNYTITGSDYSALYDNDDSNADINPLTGN